jgi:thiamine-phosphate pyrophosphorylase
LIHYLITDPKYYTSDKNSFSKTVEKILSTKKVDYVCFRDKVSSNYEELAKELISISKKYNKKSILNSNYKLAKNLDAYGVHLTSTQFDKIEIAKNLGLFVIISTHSQEEINDAKRLGADMVTYSPIYDTPNKGAPKGIDDLNRVCNLVDIDVIALGGIVSDEHISAIKKSSAVGFASIRYFI